MENVIIAGFVLCFLGATISFILAFGRPPKPIAPEIRRRRRRIGGVTGSVFVLAAVGLITFMLGPETVRHRLKEAEDLTRQTLREQAGGEPDTVSFDPTNRKRFFDDGWQYIGTARRGELVWDVTVTRSNDNAAHKTTLECQATPRVHAR